MKIRFLVLAFVLVSFAFIARAEEVPCGFNADCIDDVTKFYVHDKNYIDDDGLWNVANPVFVSDTLDWYVEDAPYDYYLPALLDRVFSFVPKKRPIKDLGVEYEFGDSFVFDRTWLNVKSGIKADVKGQVATYVDAFEGYDADFLVKLGSDRVQHYIKLKSPPDISKDVEFCFNISDEGFTLLNESKFSVKKGDYALTVLPVEARDSGGNNVGLKLKVKPSSEGIDVCKIIPKSFFEQDLVYPVFADDVFYPDEHVESSSVDGDVRRDGPFGESWADCRSGNGTSHDDANTLLEVDVNDVATTPDLQRAVFCFDTSSIDDSHTVTGATLSAKLWSKTNMDNDGDDYLAMSKFNQSSDTDLVDSDYQNGLVDDVQLSDQVDISSMSTGNFYTWTMTSTGYSLIDKTGTTCFMLREGHDLENSAPTGQNMAQFHSADASGTSDDPYLEVWHGVVDGGGGESGSGSQVGSGTTLSGALLPTATLECVLTATGASACLQYDFYLSGEYVDWYMDFQVLTVVSVVGLVLVLLLVVWSVKTFIFWLLRSFRIIK